MEHSNYSGGGTTIGAGGGACHDPPSSYGGAAPGLNNTRKMNLQTIAFTLADIKKRRIRVMNL